MLKRIRQFVRGAAAKPPTEAEEKFLHRALPEPAIAYFHNMTVGDQRHVFNVLYTALDIYETENYSSGCENPRFHINDKALLVRCVLLHDIGRGPNVGVMDKTVAVLADAIYPDYAKAKGDPDAKKRSELLYRYYHHGEIGAEMLRQIGMDKEADIIQFHHYYPENHDDNPENAIYRDESWQEGGNEEASVSGDDKMSRFATLTYDNMTSEQHQILRLLQEADELN